MKLKSNAGIYTIAREMSQAGVAAGGKNYQQPIKDHSMHIERIIKQRSKLK